jgi:hypothetical protein
MDTAPAESTSKVLAGRSVSGFRYRLPARLTECAKRSWVYTVVVLLNFFDELRRRAPAGK